MKISKVIGWSWPKSHPILEVSRNLKTKCQREFMKMPKSPRNLNVEGAYLNGKKEKTMTKWRLKQNENFPPWQSKGKNQRNTMKEKKDTMTLIPSL